MKIKTWHPEMSVEETKDLAYWERNMLALRYADGWYNDDIEKSQMEYLDGLVIEVDPPQRFPRYSGWRRVLSLGCGKCSFHIPDDFDVGNLPAIKPNWDGHTTEEKWARIARLRDIEVES